LPRGKRRELTGKRAAFAALIGLNGIDFAPAPEAATAMILSLAAGEVGEEDLACWIRDHWSKA